jgi:hypothetical protein
MNKSGAIWPKSCSLKIKHAMKITNSSPHDDKGIWQYNVVPLNHPHTFTQKMYLDPIPLPVLAQNPELTQPPAIKPSSFCKVA